MHHFDLVKPAARGRWPEIHRAVGVPAESLNGKHVPCAGCGGKNRFRYVLNDPDGKWFCGQGGPTTGGDGFSLLCHVFGWTKYESLTVVADYLGIKPDASPKARAKLQRIKQQAKAVEMEDALLHELIILEQVLSPRVAGRDLAHNHAFAKQRPEYQMPPGEHWTREMLAAKRIQNGLRILYGIGCG